MRCALTALILALVAWCVGLQPAEARSVPALTSHVVDTAKVLTPAEQKKLADYLAAFEASTTAQVVVLTVPSLEGESLFDFSQKTFRRWKLGTVRKNNGILIVYAVAEQGRRVHVGKGLEGDIPDAEAIRIVTEHLDPFLKKKEFGNAFMSATERITQLISGDAVAPEKVEARQKRDRAVAKYGLFVIAFVLLAFAHFYHPLLGGAVGGGSCAFVAWIIGLTSGAIIAAAVIGLLLGLFLRWITDVPWCGGSCGNMASTIAGAGGDALGAGAEIIGGLGG